MGRLIGIAKAPEKLASLVEMREAPISVARGVEGDVRGTNTDRQVTVLFREGWDAACQELGAQLPWTTRRANLYVEGVPIPAQGARLRIGEVVLEVTKETKPCHVMDAAHQGLKDALTPDWRGGVCCNVVNGGIVRLGDAATVEA